MRRDDTRFRRNRGKSYWLGASRARRGSYQSRGANGRYTSRPAPGGVYKPVSGVEGYYNTSQEKKSIPVSRCPQRSGVSDDVVQGINAVLIFGGIILFIFLLATPLGILLVPLFPILLVVLLIAELN